MINMAPKADKVKRVNVSGTVTPELAEFIEEHRWSNRLSKSEVINAALIEWGAGKGFDQAAAEAAKADPEADEDSEPKAAKVATARK